MVVSAEEFDFESIESEVFEADSRIVTDEPSLNEATAADSVVVTDEPATNEATAADSDVVTDESPPNEATVADSVVVTDESPPNVSTATDSDVVTVPHVSSESSTDMEVFDAPANASLLDRLASRLRSSRVAYRFLYRQNIDTAPSDNDENGSEYDASDVTDDDNGGDESDDNDDVSVANFDVRYWVKLKHVATVDFRYSVKLKQPAGLRHPPMTPGMFALLLVVIIATTYVLGKLWNTPPTPYHPPF